MSIAAPDLAESPARERAVLRAERAALFSNYAHSPRPRAFLRAHTKLVDRILRALWRDARMPKSAALAATGGYGREQLFPHSDTDILLLLADEPSDSERERLESLISLLWDVGLEPGHGVRTIATCLEEAHADITVRTTLLEARFLTGNRGLFRQFRAAFDDALDPIAFLKAKSLEQEQRHAKHQDTPYALEPNLKEAPGGLRDLHVIDWIARASKIGAKWSDLARSGLILRREAVHLTRHESYLQDLRIRLHLLAGRREDRIAFDYQAPLAAQLEVCERGTRRASEVMMQQYYRTAKAVMQLNTIVLQNLQGALVPRSDATPREINERFRMRGELLEAVSEDLFEREPRAILESFLLMQQHHALRGMTAPTLRALWRARQRLDVRLRRDPVAQLLFLQILQQSRGIVHEFRRMNQYGILGRYLPEFGRIVGQMQHDLFHVYTVDQHILMVLRNLRRFSMPEMSHEFPLCSQLMAGFERHWLLYAAALYHDIAKGRGGDHSELGAREARAFGVRHGLDHEDTELVVFLVENHLTMSNVAQRQDVHDLEVVQTFAAKVGDERRLIALYLLTVADVRGTSPKVWNGWKAKLLEDVFRVTRRALTGDTLRVDTALAEKQAEATRLLRLYALSDEVKDRFWSRLDTSYFLRHEPQEIAWQTRYLHHRSDSVKTIVKARLAPHDEGLQVMIYTPDQEALFARICGYFSRTNFNIVEAKIHTTRHGYALDTFIVMGALEGMHHRDLIGLIEQDLAQEIESGSPLGPSRTGRMSRRARHFPISPSVDIRPDERGAYQVLTIVANDRPGLLYDMARVLARHRVSLHSAKINTLGDRAEDVFLIAGAELADAKTTLKLEQELLAGLQNPGDQSSGGASQSANSVSI
ncbi:MAG: [protein-PII] uridylyltransferase [Betaproteobacteria bacterium]|nr:[protein-PII] uridylyltransferase [Betaproteobacteria bacterium]